jgi:hypothetical protein
MLGLWLLVCGFTQGCVTLPPECRTVYAATYPHCPKPLPKDTRDMIEVCTYKPGSRIRDCQLYPRHEVQQEIWEMTH